MDFTQSIQKGVAKINYYTNMALVMANKPRELLLHKEQTFYHDVMMATIDEFQADAQNVMRIFKSSNKA